MQYIKASRIPREIPLRHVRANRACAFIGNSDKITIVKIYFLRTGCYPAFVISSFFCFIELFPQSSPCVVNCKSPAIKSSTISWPASPQCLFLSLHFLLHHVIFFPRPPTHALIGFVFFPALETLPILKLFEFLPGADTARDLNRHGVNWRRCSTRRMRAA